MLCLPEWAASLRTDQSKVETTNVKALFGVRPDMRGSPGQMAGMQNSRQQ